MNAAQSPDSFEPADYLGVLRRRWWVVIVLAFIGLAGAFAYATVAPKIYTATAAVNVTPTAANQSGQVANGRTNSLVNLDTEAQLVTSTNVATIAGHLLHSTLTPSDLSQRVSVTVPPNSSIMDIACNASSGAEAAACAEDFAKAYLTNRSNSAYASINAQLAGLKRQVASLQTTAGQLKSKIAVLPHNSSKRASEVTNLKLVQAQVKTLIHQEGQVTTLLADTVGGSIITNAQTPSQPSSPQKLLVLPSGLVAGLLLGLIIAFMWDRRDKRIHGVADVERALDIPVMLDLSATAIGQQVSLAAPRSRASRSFVELAYGVTAALGEGNRVLLVAGTASPAGPSIVAANLAVTLARTHADTVLICANWDGTLSPELLGLNGSGPGLAEVVTGAASIRDVARAPAGFPGLWVITPGEDVSVAAYHLQHDTVKALITELRRQAQYVVIEAQATEEGTDAFALGAVADAALMTIEVLRTTTTEAAAAVKRLEQLRTPVLGAAVYPAMGKRVNARPPRAAVPSESRRERVGPAHRNDDALLAANSVGDLDRRNPSARPRRDPADRVRER